MKIKGKMLKKDYRILSRQTRFKKLKNKILNILARFMIIPSVRILVYRMTGVSIGKNVFIGLDSYLDDEFPELITIEDNVIIAFRVTIVAHDDAGKQWVSPVRIMEKAYIGTVAIILPGTTVGENTAIGAGAVVTKDIAPNCVAVGVPARVIKKSIELG